MLLVEGIVEQEQGVTQVWTRRVWPLTREQLARGLRSRDFR